MDIEKISILIFKSLIIMTRVFLEKITVSQMLKSLTYEGSRSEVGS